MPWKQNTMGNYSKRGIVKTEMLGKKGGFAKTEKPERAEVTKQVYKNAFSLQACNK